MVYHPTAVWAGETAKPCLRGRGLPPGGYLNRGDGNVSEKLQALALAAIPGLGGASFRGATGLAKAAARLGVPAALARILAIPAGGAAVGAGTAGVTSSSSDQPLLDQLEQGAIGGGLGSLIGPAAGVAGKYAGKIADVIGGRGNSAEEFIRNMLTPVVGRVIGFHDLDPEHWQRDLMYELGGLAGARGAGWARARTPANAPVRPTRERGPDGRFTAGSSAKLRGEMAKYRTDTFLYNRWQNIKNAGQAVNSLMPALGGLWGREVGEEEQRRYDARPRP